MTDIGCPPSSTWLTITVHRDHHLVNQVDRFEIGFVARLGSTGDRYAHLVRRRMNHNRVATVISRQERLMGANRQNRDLGGAQCRDGVGHYPGMRLHERGGRSHRVVMGAVIRARMTESPSLRLVADVDLV